MDISYIRKESLAWFLFFLCPSSKNLSKKKNRKEEKEQRREVWASRTTTTNDKRNIQNKKVREVTKKQPNSKQTSN